MYVTSAYLHTPLKWGVYLYQPLGFEKLDKNGNELVWKLNQSLHGCKAKWMKFA